MKKLIELVVIILILTVTKGFSQSPNKNDKKENSDNLTTYEEIKINLSGMSERTLDYNKTYVFVIENINRHLFKIESTITQEEYNIEIPSVFKGVKLPSYLNFSISKENVEGASLPEKDVKKIDKNLEIIKKSYENIKKIIELDNDITNLISSCDSTYNSVEKELINLIIKYKISKSRDKSVQRTDLKNHLTNIINDAIKAVDSIDKAYKLLKKTTNTLIDTNKGLMQEWEITLEVNPPKKSGSIYRTRLIGYKNWQRENLRVAASLKEVNTIITKAKALVAEMRKFKDENKVQLLIDKYNLINKSNFRYVSKPFKVTSDEVKVEITISSDKLLSCDVQNIRVFKHTYNVKRKFKIDFSTGVFFNGGNEDFLGRDLYYSIVDDVSTMIKSKDGGNRMLLGVGGLMHIYWRTDKEINFAISPGISTTSNFDELNFHLGVSVMFGRKNRIVITGGLTIRETNILDKNYDLDTAYTTSELPETVPIIKVFPRVGYFVSLTYNFSKFKSQ